MFYIIVCSNVDRILPSIQRIHLAMIGRNVHPSAEGIDVNYGADVCQFTDIFAGTTIASDDIWNVSWEIQYPGLVLPKSDARLTSPVDCTRNTLVTPY